MFSPEQVAIANMLGGMPPVQRRLPQGSNKLGLEQSIYDSIMRSAPDPRAGLAQMAMQQQAMPQGDGMASMDVGIPQQAQELPTMDPSINPIMTSTGGGAASGGGGGSPSPNQVQGMPAGGAQGIMTNGVQPIQDPVLPQGGGIGTQFRLPSVEPEQLFTGGGLGFR